MENLNKLAQELITTLSKNNKTLFSAESCTAGLLTSTVANISGSSAILLGGVVAYHNDIKTNILHVNEQIIAEYGAVSFECVFEMAKGALKISPADYVIAITGIAGPTGGTDLKPVGTVYTAILSKDNEGWAQQFAFEGTRESIREQAVDAALNILLATETEKEYFNMYMRDAREL